MKKLLLIICLLALPYTAYSVEVDTYATYNVGYGAVDNSFTGKPQTNTLLQNLEAGMYIHLIEGLDLEFEVEVPDWQLDTAVEGRINKALIRYTPVSFVELMVGSDYLYLPNVAGGSAIFDDTGTGATIKFRPTDTINATLQLFRPNYTLSKSLQVEDDSQIYGSASIGYTGENFYIEPFVVYGEQVENDITFTNTYAGLPISYKFGDWLAEVEVNYGTKYNESYTQEGFVGKAKLTKTTDFGSAYIYGWYGTGDDADNSNGSERMPTISPWTTLTSFSQASGIGWGPLGSYALNLETSGSLAIGIGMDINSIVPNIVHSAKVTYIHGTNSAENQTDDWAGQYGWYLTTEDSLIEATLDNTWSISDKLSFDIQLGYIYNNTQSKTHDKHGYKAVGVMTVKF